MAEFYQKRKCQASLVKVRAVLASKEWNRTYTFDNQVWNPEDYRPMVTNKDLTLFKLHEKMVEKTHDQLYPEILDAFEHMSGPDRDTTMTALWDELCVKVGEMDSMDDYLRLCEAICRPVCTLLTGNDSETKSRGLKRSHSTSSNKSDKSDDFSWLAAVGLEAQAQLEPENKIEEKKPMPANVVENLQTFATCTFFEKADIDAVRRAHRIRLSPDAPQLLKALFARETPFRGRTGHPHQGAGDWIGQGTLQTAETKQSEPGRPRTSNGCFSYKDNFLIRILKETDQSKPWSSGAPNGRFP